MDQEGIQQVQATPGTPLQQISQDRFNQLRLPQSPSVPAYLNDSQDSQSRRGSDVSLSANVKSKVAFLNNLANNQNGNTSTNSFAIAASPTRSQPRSALGSPSKSHSRANSTFSIPSDPSDLADLVHVLQTQLEQSRNRERLVAERVESMMEQLQSAHSRSRHEQKENDKEIKAMKKQVHKAELALIRCQQQLQDARHEQEGFKVRAEHERQAKEKSRQEAFERARTLASNVEELEVLKRERDVLKGENEALKAVQSSIDTLGVQTEKLSEKKEVGVQVQLGPLSEHLDQQSKLPTDDYLCSKCAGEDKFDSAVTDLETIQELQDELVWVKSQLKREEDLVHFMNMQCQFRTCPCRMAENAGVRFIHDYAYDRRQQELAKLKGIKRKAEDELPPPQYITLRERWEQRSRERRDRDESDPDVQLQHELRAAEYAQEESIQQNQLVEVGQNESVGQDEDTTLRATAILSNAGEIEIAGVIPLDEAADIPLPSPHSDDMEPTALLEDMTQVMVQPEPSATSKHFAFSTSTSSRRPVEAETPLLRQSHSVMTVNATDDLFDIRPPKHLPPRPSTVMGLRTIGSPIRMVPPSPEHRQSMTPTLSPPRHMTMQIPLKDSPLRNTVTQRRSQSRPRSQSRARSPTPHREMTTNEANSPSADTYFPVTPKQKVERQQRLHISIQANTQLQALQSQSQTQTTTTRVPLRGSEEDDVFSPEKASYDHADTVPLQIDSSQRGRQPLYEHDPNVHSHSTILPGTPITREAALAQIRARRDRARSVAMRKQNDDENGKVKTPKSAARRGIMLNREGMARDISNLSQASAPARF